MDVYTRNQPTPTSRDRGTRGCARRGVTGSSTRHTQNRQWTRPLRAAALAALGSVVLIGGCAQKTTQTTSVKDLPAARMEQPTVIGDQRDASAYTESSKQLTTVEWGVLDKKGPQPVWKRLGGNKDEKPVPQAQAKGFQHADKVLPATAATTRVAAAATQSIAATQPLTPIEDLPVHLVNLPDGKVRIIWTMRSYGGSTVTAKRDGGTARREVTVAPGDLAPLVAVVTAHVGAGGTVAPLARENTLVITCAKEMRDSTLALLDQLDVPPRQVQITAKIFEVSHDFDFQQGAKLLANRIAADGTQTAASTFAAQRALDAAATGTPFQGSVLNLMQTFADAGISLDASFQILADVGLIKVVSEPRMTVATGQTGYMLAGQELPIQSANFVNNAIQTTTTYKPVGVQLYITPQAVGAESVKLHAISVVSSVAGFTQLPTLTGNNAKDGNALVNPIIESREAETAVTIEDGNTLVISGLRMIRTTTREQKVPGLGDIPVLGWMFKNHRSQQQMTDLYFFVTPTLM